MKLQQLFLFCLCIANPCIAGKSTGRPRNQNPHFRPREVIDKKQYIEVSAHEMVIPSTNKTVGKLLRKAGFRNNNQTKECNNFLRSNSELNPTFVQKILGTQSTLEGIQRNLDKKYLNKYYSKTKNSLDIEERKEVEQFLDYSRKERCAAQWYHVWIARPAIAITFGILYYFVKQYDDNYGTCSVNTPLSMQKYC